MAKIDFSGVVGDLTFEQLAIQRAEGTKRTWTSVLRAYNANGHSVDVLVMFRMSDYNGSCNESKDQLIREGVASALNDDWHHSMMFVEWLDNEPCINNVGRVEREEELLQ